jgi:hypothetical protein
MDFFDRNEYTIKDLEDFLKLEVEENRHLDYKRGDALSFENKKINEITKDVSAFANSDGGLIIYGVNEDKSTHKPSGYVPIVDPKISKEWLEQKINLIQPKIKDLRIFPIRLESKTNQSIYIVKIPRSDDAPHMANDNKYYRRGDFSSDPMQGYEVRDTFFRVSRPLLRIIGVEFEQAIMPENSKFGFFFKAFIQNDNNAVATLYKLNVYVYTKVQVDSIILASSEGKLSNCTFTKMDSDCARLSIYSNEPIFRDECITMGNVYFQIPEMIKEEFIQTTIIRVVLFYEGGTTELLYLPRNRVVERRKDQINAMIKSNYPSYNARWL